MRIDCWVAAAGLVLAAFTAWTVARATGNERRLLLPAQAAAIHGGQTSSSTAPKCTLKRLQVKCTVDGPCAQSIDDPKNKCGGKCDFVCNLDGVYYQLYENPEKKWKKDGTDTITYLCGFRVVGNWTCAVKGTECVCNGRGKVSEDTCARDRPAHDPCE